MIPLVTAIVAGLIGALQARKRGGKPADMAQYATVYAIIGALVGLFGAILLSRTLA